MLPINLFNRKSAGTLIIISLLTLSACSKNDNPVDSTGSTSKVSGRISTASGSPNMLGKTGSTGSASTTAQAAVVTLAQVQADGSLKTVSTQSVQTDADGKFVVETNMSGAKNLIVVADQGSARMKAIVSSEVKSGTTVYAPPLNDESNTEADVYIKAVGEGHSSDVSDSDLKVLLNAEAAAQLSGNDGEESQFINAVQFKSQTMAQAASNSYFGFSGTQVQAFANAKENACAKLDEDLYNSNDNDNDVENAHMNFEDAVITSCASSNISANSVTELRRIGITAYTSSSASMEAQARFALTKCCYKRYAIGLSLAMSEQFQAAGAANSQMSAVSNAGVSLYTSIKNSTDMSQINDAFVQYHTSIKSQLQITLNTYAALIDTLDVAINAGGNAKALLTASTNVGSSSDVIINAYTGFYNSVKSSVQASLSAATSAQANAAAHILILANVN